MAITRTAMVDDDGSGTTGTIINNAWKQEMYDQIDAAIAAALGSIGGGWPGGVTGQIAFPATQNPSSGANVLDDYEEGTFTPTDTSGAGLTFAVANGNYVKIGQLITVTVQVTYPTTSNGNQAVIGLPFAALSAGPNGYAGAVGYNDSGSAITVQVIAGTTNVWIRNGATGTALTNTQLSGKALVFTAAYRGVA